MAHLRKPIILFDLGGVIEHHDLVYGLARSISKKNNLNFEKFSYFMMKNMRMNDKCSITDKEFINRLNNKFKLNLTVDSFYKEYFKFISSDKKMLKLARKLNEKYTVGILSNTRKRHLINSLKKWKYDKYFKFIFISQNFCARKPELRYYRLVMKKIKVKAKDLIFIDDKQKNTASARKVGMKFILYDGNISNLKKKLQGFGIDTY